VQILGFKGHKSKTEEKWFCRGAHGELTAKKWLESINKQKGRSNLKGRDRQTESTVDNNDSKLGTEINKLCFS